MLAVLVGLLLLLLITPFLLIRVRKRWVASFNLAVTNRITSRFAARLPGFGIVTHIGRKSGRIYRTPVNVFRWPDGFLIALTYDARASELRTYLSLAAASLRVAARAINFPRQPLCMTLLDKTFPSSCAWSSESLARTIACDSPLFARTAVSTLVNQSCL